MVVGFLLPGWAEHHLPGITRRIERKTGMIECGFVNLPVVHPER
jgi:hypothetical protein